MHHSFEKDIRNCVCGHVHQCSIKDVVIGKDALLQIPSLLSGIHKVLIVSDGNTRPLAFNEVTTVLQTESIAWCEAYFDQTDVVIPNEKSVEFILSRVTSDVEALVGIGSGVISDLCKYTSYQIALPYMIIATAPSMDGYASSGAAMILNGMKVTPSAHVPTWIVGDVGILKDAPMKMIRAGIGDILGKYSCLNDWKLANLILDEPLCPWVYDLVMTEVRNCVNNIDGCMNRNPKAIGDLMNSLIMVGIAMAYVGNSRPASGSEHHLSHFFEITGMIHKRNYLDHGIDVAYSSILTAHLRSLLVASDPSTFSWIERGSQWEGDIDRVYASLSPEVKKLQSETGFYDTNRIQLIQEKWPAIKATLNEAPSRREMEQLLERSGYNVSKFVSFYSDSVIRTCIEFAKDLKNRYTLLNLLQDVGVIHHFASHMQLLIDWNDNTTEY